MAHPLKHVEKETNSDTLNWPLRSKLCDDLTHIRDKMSFHSVQYLMVFVFRGQKVRQMIYMYM